MKGCETLSQGALLKSVQSYIGIYVFKMYTGGGGGDVALLRGAIFFVGMSLWGNQRIDHLDSYSPMTILPTFLQASLACTHHLVLYEITLQTERLVTKVLGLHGS